MITNEVLEGFLVLLLQGSFLFLPLLEAEEVVDNDNNSLPPRDSEKMSESPSVSDDDNPADLCARGFRTADLEPLPRCLTTLGVTCRA